MKRPVGAKIQRIIISPHFDDACLSAFDCITPSTLLVTVFGGEPEKTSVCPWDTACGFPDSHAAVLGRRKENRLAAKRMGCITCDLPFPDHQYGEAVDPEYLYLSLFSLFLKHADAQMYIPYAFGGHADHVMVNSTMARLAASVAPSQLDAWHYYADLPYGLHDGKFRWQPVRNARKKWETICCYRSQVHGMQTEYPEWNEETFAYESVFPYTIHKDIHI